MPYTLAPDKNTFTHRDIIYHSINSQSVPDPDCPICLARYGEQRPDNNTERPVSIDIPGCKHVFGDRCLHELIDTDEVYRNKCPMCRTIWFSIENDGEELWAENFHGVAWLRPGRAPGLPGRPRLLRQITRTLARRTSWDDQFRRRSVARERTQHDLDWAAHILRDLRREWYRRQGIVHPTEDRLIPSGITRDELWASESRWANVAGQQVRMERHVLFFRLGQPVGYFEHESSLLCPRCTDLPNPYNVSLDLDGLELRQVDDFDASEHINSRFGS